MGGPKPIADRRGVANGREHYERGPEQVRVWRSRCLSAANGLHKGRTVEQDRIPAGEIHRIAQGGIPLNGLTR